MKEIELNEQQFVILRDVLGWILSEDKISNSSRMIIEKIITKLEE